MVELTGAGRRHMWLPRRERRLGQLAADRVVKIVDHGPQLDAPLSASRTVSNPRRGLPV